MLGNPLVRFCEGRGGNWLSPDPKEHPVYSTEIALRKFRDASVISWIVLGRYHHQLFDKAWIARIAFMRKFDIH